MDYLHWERICPNVALNLSTFVSDEAFLPFEP